MVKTNNERKRKDGMMIPITSNKKLEKVFLDICGPFPPVSYTHLDVYKRQSLTLPGELEKTCWYFLYIVIRFSTCVLVIS